ncbi:flagellar protein FliT [Saccharophagus sp. K07]|uniref:Wadjet anti-phage system protein JetA family protein n=1 Tax=Saccharophagus sp. K07 TaxID=2283636 RepID=UPI001652B26E|nr:Wadjet anti-phage system protein JetA family protein [Saccharophagus sp. K07]MBC6906156.1 flagellar protein FliT [Saccharophagus sp. K07]
MFFNDQRHQFFKPLTTKYREQVVECLCLLHQRLYGSAAEYGQSLTREQVIDIFEEALARAPLLEADGDEVEQRFKSNREQANWILKLLLDHGWIERKVDTATLQTSYPLTRAGRLFSLPLEEIDRRRVRTRHRNTRNTLNSLEAFASRGEVHDLLDALEYSERIIADFTDVISELEERKRDLVKQVESQLLVQQATDQFFEFMEKRFQPDLSIRLSADSVEKHRDRIAQVIQKIRRRDKNFLRDAEQRVRTLAPELVEPNKSVLWYILDTIELRMRNASDIMLPALRMALQSFTKRADIIIRQLSYISVNRDDVTLRACDYLASVDDTARAQALERMGSQLASVSVGLIDPAQVKLTQRKAPAQVNTNVEERAALDPEAQKEMMIQALLDQAFVLNNQTLTDYIRRVLADGSRVSSRDLPIKDARELLAAAHIIELGAINNLSSDYEFHVTFSNKEPFSNRYFSQADDFVIELREKHGDTQHA